MDFIYEAKTLENDIRRGSLSADSVRDAARILQLQGLFVLRLSPASRNWRKYIRGFTEDRSSFALSFFRQLSVMLRTGMPLSEALEALLHQTGTERERDVLAEICRSVRGGGTLAAALRARPDWFPAASAAIVEAGEASGTLEVLLAKLADSMRKQHRMREKRMTLLAYPAILLLTSVFSAAFLFTFVFPMFVQFFSELNATLPLPTRIVLGLYELLQSYGLLLIGMILLLLAEGLRRYRTLPVRRRADHMLLHVPLIGRLILWQELSKIAGTLAVLIDNGIVLNDAMYITAGVTENAYLSMVLERAGHDVEKGETVSASFDKARIFPALFMTQLRTGETAGAVTEMLGVLESCYTEESDELAQRLQAMIEPCMVLLAGGVIGTLVLAIALPVLDMMTALGG